MIESSAAEFTTKVQGMIVALMEEVKQLDNATELTNAAFAFRAGESVNDTISRCRPLHACPQTPRESFSGVRQAIISGIRVFSSCVILSLSASFCFFNRFSCN